MVWNQRKPSATVKFIGTMAGPSGPDQTIRAMPSGPAASVTSCQQS